MNMVKYRGLATLIILLAGAPLAFSAESSTRRLSFIGPEIFPIENGIAQLHAADLNGDGLLDLVVVNNARAKISLLYNQTGNTNQAADKPAALGEINDLPPDARFRVDSIPAEKRIGALAVADLNGDGRPDLAYYGEPKELLVLYNEKGEGWSAPKRFAIDDGQMSANAMTVGDINGDGRLDLVLLAENHAYLIYQQADHTLSEPQKLPLSEPVRSVQVLDLDGDGRNDLLLTTFDGATPFRLRLQQAEGQLGPEIFFRVPAIRSFWGDHLEHDRQTYLTTVLRDSGRAQVAQFVRKPAEPLADEFKQGQFQVLPLDRTTKAKRGLIWADVNQDGRPDLLVAEPERGQLSVYLQNQDASLASPRRFPTLAGVSEIAAADWDGDGQTEIFLLSADERQVGVTRLDSGGRVPFPELIALEGKPVTLAVGQLQPTAKPVLAVISVPDDDRRALTLRSADGAVKTWRLNQNFKANPTTLLFHDVDQDGRMDLVALTPYEKVKVLLQKAGSEDFEEQDVAPPGGLLEQPWSSIADVDADGKPELLLAQKNFLRAVLLRAQATTSGGSNKTEWGFQVKEQINGAAANSRLIGATAVARGANDAPALFLLDAERKSLTLCERDASGVWQVVRNVPLPVAGFTDLQAVKFGSTPLPTVAFTGGNTVAWMSLAGEVWDYNVLDDYETPIQDGFLTDVTAGDLTGTGRKDLVFLETSKHYLDLVSFTPEHKLRRSERWPVFEQRSFRPRSGDANEPREVVVADLTGDGKNDLAVVVHDRILLYPQE